MNTPASKTKATKKTKDTLRRKLSATERVHGELSDSPSSFTPPSSKNENHQKKKELFHLQSEKNKMRPRQLNMESTPINEQLLKATQKNTRAGGKGEPS